MLANPLFSREPLPLERLVLAARLTLQPLLWEQVEKALNPLMPEPRDLARILQTQLQDSQARAFTQALTSHYRHGVAELPWTDQSPYLDRQYIYNPPHLYQGRQPSGGVWELLLPLYRHGEHQAALRERQEALLELRQRVQTNLNKLAQEMRLKSPDSLLALPRRMSMTLTYRSLSQMPGPERPPLGEARRYLEANLRRDWQERISRPEPVPAEGNQRKQP